jgi:hypothetical protein
VPGPAAGTLREDALLAGYLFFGEDDYQAEEFVAELKRVLAASTGGEFHLTRTDLDEAKWREVIDTARTAPFLFEPWRAIVVRVPERKSGADRKGGAEGEAGRGGKYLTTLDQKILKDYFADPPPRTVLVVIRAGRVRRDDAMVRFFQSLPKTAISVTEMKRLSEYRLKQRAEEKARALGKTLTERAKTRLMELLGQDLRRLRRRQEGDRGVRRRPGHGRPAQLPGLRARRRPGRRRLRQGRGHSRRSLRRGGEGRGHPWPPGRLLPQRPGRPDLAQGEKPGQGRDLPNLLPLHLQKLRGPL